MNNNILITGGAGFVGSCQAKIVIENNHAKKITIVDAGLTGSNFEWIRPYAEKENVTILKKNLADDSTYNELLMRELTDIDIIYNLASESHVDRSIDNGTPFLVNNMIGTGKLLEFCKDYLPNLKMFLQFSTDEVLGTRSIDEGSFKPDDRKMVRNVYSATKSAQEELAYGYAITHNLPIVITRCSNIYGPRQFFEKLLPKAIKNLYENKKVPIYGAGLQQREWIFVEDVCEIVMGITKHMMGKGINPKDVHKNIFHIGSETPWANIKFIEKVIKTYHSLTNIDPVFPTVPNWESKLEFVEDRKGHDFRYDLDCSTTHDLGLAPKTSLDDGLKKTIKWYLEYFKG